MPISRKKFLFSLIILPFLDLPLFADKSSVEIEVKPEAKKGSEVTIRLKVKHHGNNVFHHTDWAQIFVNGKEEGKWLYPSFKEEVVNDIFIKEIKIIAENNLEIEAEASCNIHGSAGKKTATVTVK